MTAETYTENSEWVEVASWQGDGNKKTEPFSVSGEEWRIRWTKSSTSHRPGYVTVFVHHSDDRLVGLAVNERVLESGESYLHEQGEFYLDIVSRRAEWEIIVEEKRT